MGKKINLGLIGAGYWGGNYVKTLDGIEQADLRYVCDVKQKNEGRNVQDYERILEDKNIEAVVVATPTPTHYQISKDCLEAGKHVLVEKPMTSTYAESKELVEVTEKSGKHLMVGHIFMYHPAVNLLKEKIDGGELGGRIFSMTARRLNLGPIRSNDNVMWDLTPHDISMFTYLSGESPLQVNATGSSFINPSLEDIVSMNIKFSGNIFSNVVASWIYPLKVRDLVVVGDKKMAIFDDNGPNKLAIYDKRVDFINDLDLEDYSVSLRDGDIHLPKVSATSPLKLECEHFLDCVQTGQRPLSDGFNGAMVVNVLESAEKSLKNNGNIVNLK